MKVLFVSTLLAVLLPSTAHALTRYRCEGWVQFTPCQEGQKRSMFRGQGSSPRAQYRRHAAAAARIVTQALQKVSSKEGIWRGRVYGDGTTRLFLEISQGGEVTERRYIGEVYLEKKETWFAFRSVLPNGNNWDWNVVVSG